MKPISRKKQLRELKSKLAYAQLLVRLDIKSLERSKIMAKEVASRMRALQEEIKQGKK